MNISAQARETRISYLKYYEGWCDAADSVELSLQGKLLTSGSNKLMFYLEIAKNVLIGNIEGSLGKENY